MNNPEMDPHTKMPASTAKATIEGVGEETLFAVLDELEKLGVRVWVHGGWAIDALTGTSRPHKDIDLLADEKDRPRLRETFATSITDETSHKLEFSFQGVPVEVTFFRKLWNGSLITVTPRIVVLWSRNSFGDRYAPLGNRAIPVVGVGTLYAEVANRTKKKKEMLEKNSRDLQRLQPLLTETIEKAAQKHFPRPNTFWNRLRLYLGM